MALARRLGDDLPQELVQKRAVGQPCQDVVLRQLVRLRRRDLELLGALRDLVLERALIGGDLGLRLGESLRHVVEGMRQQAQLVARLGGNIHVELACADRARGAHELPHRRDQPAREHEREHDGDDDQRSDDRQGADQIGAHSRPAAIEAHSEPDVSDDGAGRGARRVPQARRRLDRHDKLQLSPVRESLLDNGRVAGGGRGDRRHGHLCAGVTASDQWALLHIENGNIGDIAIGPETVEHRSNVRHVGGADRLVGHLGEHRRHGEPLRPEAARFVSNLLADQKRGDAQCRCNDQADREQIELGEQPDPNRRRIERRDRVAAEGREQLGHRPCALVARRRRPGSCRSSAAIPGGRSDGPMCLRHRPRRSRACP